ncbi:hypothetical protein M413DRAFT_204404 [Hebeloma cylindrosporum]|uniref:Uncharacterized protein n=1 Tax=Hebeloma cylindrosporum TaxID=76867 RepID=A0A0C3CU35_HEBCY|nr:hypothetical protein M413DRAFT_204404 [Hebeloma cylindrosporum h7]
MSSFCSAISREHSLPCFQQIHIYLRLYMTSLIICLLPFQKQGCRNYNLALKDETALLCNSIRLSWFFGCTLVYHSCNHRHRTNRDLGLSQGVCRVIDASGPSSCQRRICGSLNHLFKYHYRCAT